MIKVFWSLIKIFLGVAALGWLLSNPGSVVLNWQGWRIDTHSSVLAIAIVILGWGLYMIFHFFWMIRTLPKRVQQGRITKHYKKGISALTDGFIAVSEGNRSTAQQCLDQAERHLKNPELTGLLAVQTAHLSGDSDHIKTQLIALLNNKKTTYLGVRGLLQQALHKGAWQQANVLVDDALRLRPKSVWVVEKSLMTKAHLGDYNAAMTVLENAFKVRVFEKSDYEKRKANLLYHMAQQCVSKQDLATALSHLTQAQKLDAGNVDIVNLGVDILQTNQDIKTLEKWILTLWAINPTPELFKKYRMAAVVAENKQQVRLKRLAKQNRNHPITRTMMANYFVETKQFKQAQEWLNPLVKGRENGNKLTRQVCLLMAEIEEHQNHDLIASERWRQLGEKSAEELDEPTFDSLYVPEPSKS